MLTPRIPVTIYTSSYLSLCFYWWRLGEKRKCFGFHKCSICVGKYLSLTKQYLVGRVNCTSFVAWGTLPTWQCDWHCIVMWECCFNINVNNIAFVKDLFCNSYNFRFLVRFGGLNKFCNHDVHLTSQDWNWQEALWCRAWRIQPNKVSSLHLSNHSLF